MPELDVLLRDAPLAVDTGTRQVTARLFRYNDPRQVRDPDGASYREAWAPGSIVTDDGPLHVLDAHGGNLVGHVAAVRDVDGGAVADLVLADTVAGRDVTALIEAGTLTAVSVEFVPDRARGEVWTRDRSQVTRTKALVRGLAFTFRPAHDSPILALREQDPPVNDLPIPAPTVTVRELDVDAEFLALRAQVAELDQLTRARQDPAVHPLARFESAGEWFLAAHDDPVLARALADQVTTANPGVIPPGWATEVRGIVDLGRPFINAIGRSGLPGSGMDVNWPYFDGDLLTLVGAQATQKTEITSVVVALKKGTAAIVTYAGGSDISLQTLQRSSPSYLDSYLRIMAAAYAAVTDKAAVAAAGALSGKWHTLDEAVGTLADFTSALLLASVDCQMATGQPASVVALGTTMFTHFAPLILASPSAVVSNPGASLATLEVTFGGVPIVHEPHLNPIAGIVTNRQAATFYEDGPMTVSALDVAKLGQDTAVWGMATLGSTTPNGIVKLSKLQATPTDLTAEPAKK